MSAPKNPRPRPHSEETVTLALTLLAAHAGRVGIVSDELAKQGISIAHQTLSDWKNRTHVYRYHELREKYAKDIAVNMARQAEEYVAHAATVERKVLDQLERQVDEGTLPAKDLATALQKISDSRAKNMEKIANPLTGRATQTIRVEHDTPQEVYAKLRELGVIVDDEPVDAEVVQDQLPPGRGVGDDPQDSTPQAATPNT